MEANPEKTWYHYASDEQGSTVFITGKNGEVKNRYTYDAFGNTIESEEQIPNRYQYTGQQFDQITQQYYLRARCYNPAIVRLTQEDEYHGDGLNLYAYCANNPVDYYDPSGYSMICDKKAKLYNKLLDERKLSREQYKELSHYNRVKRGIKYGELDNLGRATGVSATITEEILGTGSSAYHKILPAGFKGGEI